MDAQAVFHEQDFRFAPSIGVMGNSLKRSAFGDPSIM